jgi:hypothetical protein
MIDGMMVQNPIFGGFATTVGTFSINQMTVQTGTFDASYGNALAGVINISTREGGSKMAGQIQYNTSRPFGLDALATEAGQANANQNVDYSFSGPVKFIPKLKYSISGSFGSQVSSSYFFDDITWDDHRGVFPTSLEIENAYARNGTMLVSSAQAKTILTPVVSYGKALRWINPVDMYTGWRGFGWNNSLSLASKFTYSFTNNLKLNVNFRHSQSYNLPISFQAASYSFFYFWPVGRWTWIKSGYRPVKIDANGSVTGHPGQLYLTLYPKLNWEEYTRERPPYDMINKALYYNTSGPNSNNVNFTTSQTYSFMLNHVLAKNTIYTVSGQLFHTQRKVRELIDPTTPFANSMWKYAPNWDNIRTKWEYLYGSYGYYYDPWESVFLYENSQYWYDGDQTDNFEGKIDFTSQITQKNNLRTGISIKYMSMYEEEYQASGAVSTVPVIYHMFPKEGGIYLSDKIEWSTIVLNIGLRLDYANAGGSMWADPLDPLGKDPNPFDNLLNWNGYVTAKRKFKVSPRFGVSFPLTDMTIVRFNFGHIYQNPNYRDLYRDINVRNRSMQGGGIVGNTSLQPEKAISYEIGVAQQIGQLFSIDATLWLRETTNQVGSVNVPARSDLGGDNPYGYSVFLNYNFASARGFDFSITKRMSHYFSGNLSYSWSKSMVLKQTSWDGYWDSETYAMLPKRMVPAEWDQPNSIRGSVDFILPSGFGPTVLGFKPLSAFGFTFNYSGMSGYSFSPSTYSSGGLGTVSTTYQMPFQHDVSGRVRRTFTVFDYQCQVFAQLGNLFNTRVTQYPYLSTGTANYMLTGDYTSWSATRLDGLSTSHFGQGRNISFGFRVNF